MTPQQQSKRPTEIIPNFVIKEQNSTKNPNRNHKIFGSIKMNTTVLSNSKVQKVSNEYRSFKLPDSLIGSQHSSFKITPKQKVGTMEIFANPLGAKNNS